MLFRHFTHAIVRGVPKSLARSAVGLNGKVNLEKAKMQHKIYVSTLREVGLEIIELPPDENYPDCVFVEDTAVVCNGTALVSKPGHPTRRKEADYMRSILKNELGLQVSEIEDPAATLDGGDVLFTGKEFFVGLSGRTNQAGVSALASTFSEFPCVPIKVDKALHLKCLIGMAGPDLMCVDPSAEGRDTYSRLQKAANFQYQTLDLPEVGAANVVLVNGTLLHGTTEELPKLANIFQEQLSHLNLKPINISEFRKANGNLTCCSILIHKSET
ncbi:unnamed protein product [Meganyctiphanes norvegica]|uniref:Dimethylargininase n=1 Tax=Meganyctiphanes norvegica TaxID=48144 RepID=A0AAV2QAC0_MEGNR